MVTLNEVKSYLLLSGATYNAYDIILNNYIDLASEYIQGYLENRIHPVTNVLDKIISLQSEEKEYVLEAFPVSNVIVKLNDDLLIENEAYKVDYDAGVIYFLDPDYKSLYKLSYTYGYAVENVPKDLKLVTLQAIKSLFDTNRPSNNIAQGASSIQSKRIGDYSVTFADDSGETSPHRIIQNVLEVNHEILKKYKRVTVY